MSQFHDRFPETAPGHPGQGFYVGFMLACSLLELGAFVGCLFYPKFADRFSRKWGLSFAVVWFCVGAILQTASVSYGVLVAGRAIGGVGVGTLALGAPLYISEVSPPNMRGSLLVLEQFSIVIGGIISYWITYGTQSINSEWAFRLPFLLQMAPSLFVGIGIHLFPYSPRWLCMRGRNEDSLKPLSTLRRLPTDDDRVQLEWKGIMAEVQLKRESVRLRHGDVTRFKVEMRSWLDLFSKRYRKRTAIAMATPFFQQFSGINAFVYYAPILFAALGQSPHMALILSGMINMDQFVGAVTTTLFIDKLGRRFLAISGGIAMGIPHAILAGMVGKYNSSWATNPGPAWFGVALVYIYVSAFGLSYGPLGWTLPAEVYPNAIRAKGVGLSVATNWLANFIIGVAVPPMIQGIGFGTYIFFACWCFIATAFAYFMIPETSNLTLEQIDMLFNDNAGQQEAALRDSVAQDVRRASAVSIPSVN